MAGTRTSYVMSEIRRRIDCRALARGEKLPSIRRMASALDISPSTVVDAYDRLVAEGLIRAQPGSGFYVSEHTPAHSQSDTAALAERAIDPFWVSRQSLDAAPDTLKPGCGWLPEDWMPVASLRKAMRALARDEDAPLTAYGSTQGSPPLRELLARRFSVEGLHLEPERILLTGSGTQAIDLVCRLLLQPGDTVLIDDPCYFNFQALLKAHQVHTISVPYTPTGPDIERFSAALENDQPRLYITNSALHNPTGATLSPQNAHHLLAAAAKHNLNIVEDDIFSDFEPASSTRLAALDGLNRVIRIGSFSKTLSASMRCGFIAARADWIESLVDLQVATSFGGPSPVAAELIHRVLHDGSYNKHMASVRLRLAQAGGAASNGSIS